MIEIVRRHIVPAAYAVLPREMCSPEATAFVLAIGHQESGFAARRQLPKGPARGFWQFEASGATRGVIGHERTRDHLKAMWRALGYVDPITPFALQEAIAHNDILAFGCARLLVWTLPWSLPRRGEPDRAYAQYESKLGWNPGKPRPERWTKSWAVGWEGIKEV